MVATHWKGCILDSLLKLTLRASEPSCTLDTRKADRAKEDIFHEGGWHRGDVSLQMGFNIALISILSLPGISSLTLYEEMIKLVLKRAGHPILSY